MNTLHAIHLLKTISCCSLASLIGFVTLVSSPGYAQPSTDSAVTTSSIGSDSSGRIIIEAHSELPKPPVFFTASAQADVQVNAERIEQVTQLTLKVIQGEAGTLSLGLSGPGNVVEVQSDQLQSWSVRQEGDQRFLDLHVTTEVTELTATVTIHSQKLSLPGTVELPHLTPGKSVGFFLSMNINYSRGLNAAIAVADGFAPLDSTAEATRFQTTTGGQLKLRLTQDGSAPAPVELSETTLVGDLHPNGKSIDFQLRTTVHVTKANAEIAILSGNAAVSQLPANENYRLRLATVDGQPVYQLVFAEPGTYPLALDFVAALAAGEANQRSMDFMVAASAVVPLTLRGLDEELQFNQDQQSIVPIRDNGNWVGFLPATGRARLQWKSARKTGEGKLFFTTNALIETTVGAGLLRQQHQVNYQVLQGELKSINIALHGPGEILDVQGTNIVAWQVTGEGQQRQLSVSLSQPITSESQIAVRSQTPLGAFPVQVSGLRLEPLGAIRHSGYLRLTNRGAVRMEPTGMAGLTQLAPEQFPGEATQARQVFVYRLPTGNYQLEISVDRIQPEVNISQLVLYALAETDRTIRADIELDIREAPIREWSIRVPADYSVVSVSGASVADYIVANNDGDTSRNLKVIFGQDVGGRQLVSLHLEKNAAAANENWVLPKITFPEAKSVRGNIGIIGAPGFRIAVGQTELLAEQPLSYFPKPVPNLQQAFRIREPDWSATMQIEQLDRSVQSDVFHLYSLSQGTAYGSALINYFVTGAPVSEWTITVPTALGNVTVDGENVRTWRREGETLIVTLHQPVMGPYTLLLTFEEKPDSTDGTFQAGQIAPIGVQGERGYVQVVSPMQVEISAQAISDGMLTLDPLELPAEFRLLSAAPSLGTWQYTERPFNLNLKVNWFEPGTTVTQVVEFSEAASRVSQDGELVTDVLYYVKSRGQHALKVQLPAQPVRLWEVSVDGQPVTARQADGAMLIPLPGGTDPNIPVEVRLRLGKPAVSGTDPVLTLPAVFAPVLKTQWNISGEEQRVLVPTSGTVEPPEPVLRPSGFTWVAKHGIVALIFMGVLTGVGTVLRHQSKLLQLVGLAAVAAAIFAAFATANFAFLDTGEPTALQLSLPVLSAEEVVEVHVQNLPLWRANLSWTGIIALVGGLVVLVRSLVQQQNTNSALQRIGGIFLIALGVLMQRDGAPWFFTLFGFAVLVLVFIPQAWQWLRMLKQWLADSLQKQRAKREPAADQNSGTVTASILLLALAFSSLAAPLQAAVPDGFQAADTIKQQWQLRHQDQQLTATGTVTLSGKPGDRFVLLKAPAVLTQFTGEGLRLTKLEVPGQGLVYMISIPVSTEENADEQNLSPAPVEYQAKFEFQLAMLKPTEGIAVPTGIAAVQEIDLAYDEAGWEVTSPTAARVEAVEAADANATQMRILLGPGEAILYLNPKARDLSTEATQFYVEAWNLYLPGPGVVEGRHRLHIRTSQGQVHTLEVQVPTGLTVSEVGGPVVAWQFDAESGRLQLEIESTQSPTFDLLIDTQRSLGALPADVSLAPLTVTSATGEVGLVALAFGPDAQPESSASPTMSEVNLGDFDMRLLRNEQLVLHKVYRYGAEGGQLDLRVAPVAPEVRVASKQVLSLGDERTVMGINFAVDITRAGLFQLSFPLPEGYEVESLTGAALHHWAELTVEGQRRIILHLNGKTLGRQNFSLALTGATPTDTDQWTLPRFELTEATRQTGDLVVQPATGIRLRTISRQNVSETDPRSIGATTNGALAFHLLQQDWNLVLGIEKLEPWITGQVLHDISLREGQTRTALLANFNVQNASIRSLQVALPPMSEDEIKTLRMSGKTVSDFIRTDPNSNVWEIQLKRHVVGEVQLRIEYERRGERENEIEVLTPADFPEVRQMSYFLGVRAGGRLEIDYEILPDGWQRADWNSVPQSLREAGNRHAPALTLRAVAPTNPLTVRATRHALADALKLRVAEGTITTIISPIGDQLTAVDLTMDVIQRSSLSVGLPAGGELFSIFVNDESVQSIRQGNNTNAWQFYILPGIDDRTAKVRFVYTVPGERISNIRLISPQLNVPLEQIEWNVIAPRGFELTDNDGDLELVRQALQDNYDRNSYLSKVSGKRDAKARQAAQLLEKANQLLQAGEQSKARWALNNVANRYALDAASNEDARVQLQNLQTQQAIVGLNTRRQRVYLDNDATEGGMIDNQQLREAAANNPILQQDELNFRPQQLSELLRGNTSEGNAVLRQIAVRLVQHQRTIEPAPQAITISLPEEGTAYAFKRSVQVAEDAPLELDLSFGSQHQAHTWQITLVVVLLVTLAFALTGLTTREATPPV